MRRVFRKIKAGFKKVVSQKSRKTQSSKVTKISKVGIRPKRKAVLVQPEMAVKKIPIEVAVEKSKFYTPARVEEEKRVTPLPSELPSGYGQDKMVLQVRDPWWVHAYWEITNSTWERLRREFPTELSGGFKKVLRVYDISNIIFTGDNAHHFFDIEVAPETNNWYIDTQGDGRSWCVDFGLLPKTGKFITVVRSNTVITPIAGPSWITDEEWMIPEEMFARLYGMGFGFGRSSPVGKAWQERFRQMLFSGVLASPGMASMVSPVKKIPKERKFWLMVNTELIVYGATEPDAKVSVQGREIKLRPDGTFTLRFALPDGRQVIPVRARSSDGKEEKTITPIVSKETRNG